MEFSLQENEKILWEGKPVGWFDLYKTLTYLPIAVLVITFILMVPSLFSNFLGTLFYAIIIISIILFPPILLITSLQYKNEYYWITNKRVVRKRGLLTVKMLSIPIDQVSNLFITKNLGGVLGIANLKVESNGNFSPIELQGLSNAQELYNTVDKLLKRPNAK